MAGIVARRPWVGIAAGALFGALGWLLLGIRGSVFFILSGSFFLFVAIVSILTAVSRRRRHPPST